MNSFVPFHLKDSKPVNTLPNFPRISIPNSFPNQMEVPKLQGFFAFPGSYSPTNSDLRTASTNSVCLSPLSNYSPPKQSPPVVNPGLNNLLMTLKMQQNLQNEIFRAQMQQLADLKNSLLQKLNQQPQVQTESAISPVQNIQKQTSVPPVQEPQPQQSTVKVEAYTNEVPQKNLSKKGLKAQIKDIVLFVLDNFGRVSESSFEQEKQKYSDNKDLVLVFDMLNAKYASTIKTKEEMVKYTLRRAFKFIKSSVKKTTQGNSKGVSKVICNKYFHVSQEDFSKVGNEEDFLKVVLPFRKNSKNKTMNTTFINEVFASEEFCRDYQAYLESFESILEADNKNKVERLISFIEECLNKNKLGVKNFNVSFYLLFA